MTDSKSKNNLDSNIILRRKVVDILPPVVINATTVKVNWRLSDDVKVKDLNGYSYEHQVLF